MRLHTKILTSLVAGAAIGALSQLPALPWLRSLLLALEPLGTTFIRLMTMTVIPLVIGSLFTGITSLGDVRALGRIGGRTLAYFVITTLLAATIGLVVALIVRPGLGMAPAVGEALAAQSQGPASTLGGERAPGLVQLLVEMIPQNPLGAAAQMDLLPLIVSIVIFASAMTVLPQAKRQGLEGFFQGVNDVSMVVVKWVMALAPYGVFLLIAATVARFGLGMFQKLMLYAVVVFAALALHVLGTFSLVLRFMARVRITTFYKRVSAPLLVGFSTSSSNAALPISMEAATKELGISQKVASFVIPTGATLNKNGSAIYKAVTAVFLAELYGVPLGPVQGVTIVLAATLAALAGVGVPGSSLITTLIVLKAIGLGPHAAAGIALVAGIDRILDMVRTTVNVTDDLVCATFIARSEGEELRGLRGHAGA